MVKLEEMSEGHLSDESPERKYSSKRNRISFVCQACRKSKTKCDREKPRCSRCSKINIKCVYDIEKQRAPRVPSKDATIKRLSQELEYWKKKASHYMEMEESGLFPPHKKEKTKEERGSYGKMSIDDVGRSDEESLSQETLLSVGGKQVPAPEDIAVNFYEHCPQLLVKDTMKRDIKPSCELSQIRQDKFLAIFISSVFASASKNALIHSIPSDDVSPHLDRAKQKQNAIALRNTMFRLANSDRDREHIIQFTDRIIEGNTMAGSRAGFYIRMFTHTQYKNYIEDYCPRGAKYSEVLKDVIVKVEMFLPPLRIVKKYLVHFYKFVYPVVPFLDVGLFESVLAELLKEDPIDTGRAKLNIGHDKIRSKIENIAILLIVLKLSNISMGFSQPASDKGTLSPDIIECLTNYPISDEAITLSQTAIVSVNLFNWTNENSITCLLYLWAFFVFGPQEGDFGLGQPTEVILSLVNSMAINIGLHRDPSTYEQLNDPTVSDPRIRNYRRKLWICIFVVCRYETSLRGKYPQAMRDHTASFLNADFPQQYMESVLADMPERDPYAIMIHSLTFKRYQLLLMITELDEISIHSNIRIPLARIEALLENIWQFLENDVPSDLSNFTDESELIPLNLECSGSNEFVDIIKIKKLVFFQTFMIKKLTIMRTVINLMLYFEKMTFDGREYMPYFQKYFILTVKETVQFTDLFLQHLNCAIDDPYLFFMKYKLDKIAQLSASSVFFSLLSIILRMVHSEYLLQKALQNGDMIGVEDIYVTKQKIELISSIKDNTIDTLEILCTVVTKKLGFTYFSVFQMLIFFDYCNQIIKKREVLNIFSRITQLTYHPKVRRRVYEGFGIDVEKKDVILQFLNDTTFIKQSNLQQLQLLKEFSTKIPGSFVDIVPPDNTLDVKNGNLLSPISNDHAGCSVTNNLPFPVIPENSPAFVVVQNPTEPNQAFTGEFQNFPTAQLDPLISFEDLDLLDYEFLFGSTG